MRFTGSSVLFVSVMLTGCGGSGTSPSGPTQTPGICRNYASSVTATTTTTDTGMDPVIDTQSIAAFYNTGTNRFVETGTGVATNGQCRTTTSWSTSYDSIADFVDEVSVLPPKTRWTSQSGVSTS